MDGLNLLGSTLAPSLVAKLAIGFVAFATVVAAVVAGDTLLGWLLHLVGVHRPVDPNGIDEGGRGRWDDGDQSASSPIDVATSVRPSRRRATRRVRRPRLVNARPARRPV